MHTVTCVVDVLVLVYITSSFTTRMWYIPTTKSRNLSRRVNFFEESAYETHCTRVYPSEIMKEMNKNQKLSSYKNE